MIQIELKDFQENPGEGLQLATQDEVVLMENGQGKFILEALPDDDDDAWEEALLQDPRFIAKLERSRQQAAQGDFVRFEEIDFSAPDLGLDRGGKD